MPWVVTGTPELVGGIFINKLDAADNITQESRISGSPTNRSFSFEQGHFANERLSVLCIPDRYTDYMWQE
jgi:hypothetical protein